MTEARRGRVALPDTAAIADVAAALDLALPSGATDRLARYAELLSRWNAVHNLTAVRDGAGILIQHLADCLSLVGPLRRETRSLARPARILDVGSGGGLPGLVVAAAEPGWTVDCAEPVGKKAAFLRQAAAELGLRNVAIHAEKAESLPVALRYDCVTARAFGSLERLVSVSRHVLAADGVWVAMKGTLPDEEMAALPSGVEVFHVERLRVPRLDAERHLVWIRFRPE